MDVEIVGKVGDPLPEEPASEPAVTLDLGSLLGVAFGALAGFGILLVARTLFGSVRRSYQPAHETADPETLYIDYGGEA